MAAEQQTPDIGRRRGSGRWLRKTVRACWWRRGVRDCGPLCLSPEFPQARIQPGRVAEHGCSSRIVLVFAELFFGVEVGVGAGLAVVEVGGWDPFGFAVLAFSGFP